MLLPYVADDLWYNQCLVTPGMLDVTVDTVEFRVASKVTIRPGLEYQVEVAINTAPPSNLEGYSYILDLYPQRNL